MPHRWSDRTTDVAAGLERQGGIAWAAGHGLLPWRAKPLPFFWYDRTKNMARHTWAPPSSHGKTKGHACSPVSDGFCFIPGPTLSSVEGNYGQADRGLLFFQRRDRCKVLPGGGAFRPSVGRARLGPGLRRRESRRDG